MQSFFKLIIFTFLFIGGTSPAHGNPEIIGTWRGTIDASTPDGRGTLLYFGVNINESDGVLSGIARSFPALISGDVSNVTSSNQQIRFDFTDGQNVFRFAGILKSDSSLIGTAISGQTEHHVSLERVNMPGPGILSERAGLYNLADGRTIFLGDGPWYFDLFDLGSGRTTTLFPRAEDSYFAGPSGYQPTPIKLQVRFSNDETGHRQIILDEDGQTITGTPSTSVTTEEVTFGSGNLILAGTLYRPANRSRKGPGIVSMVGSGQQDRFGFNNLNAHRAMWLANQGVTVLIYDKRGVGSSQGDYEARTPQNMAEDLANAADYLAAREDVDPAQIGLLVHSQSGIYAPISISLTEAIKFAIVLNASVVNGEIQEIIRTKQQLAADGWPQHDVDAAVATQILKFYYANHRVGWGAYVAAYNQIKDKPWFENIVGSTIDKERHSWDFWRSGNSYEPSEEWAKVNIPVLFFFGEHDTINAVEQGIALLNERSFANDRAGLLTLEIMQEANHDMFMAPGGGEFDKVFADKVSPYLKLALDWLNRNGFGPG